MDRPIGLYLEHDAKILFNLNPVAEVEEIIVNETLYRSIGRQFQTDPLLIKILLVGKLIAFGLGAAFLCGKLLKSKCFKQNALHCLSRLKSGGIFRSVFKAITPSKNLPSVFPLLKQYPSELHSFQSFQEVTYKTRASQFRTITESDKVQTFPEMGPKIKEVCQKAKVPRLEYSNIGEVFHLVTNYLALAVSYHLTDKKNFPGNYDSTRDQMDSAFWFMNNSGCAPEKIRTLQDILRVCLGVIPDPMRVLILDNIADSLLWKIDFPAPIDFNGTCLPGEINLARFLSPFADHASLQQLFSAAFVNDPVKLKKCLDTGISPWITATNGCSVLDVAIRQQSHECVRLLLERVPYPIPKDDRYWGYLDSLEMAFIFIENKIPPFDIDGTIKKNLLTIIKRNYLTATPQERKEWLAIFVAFLPMLPRSVVEIHSSGKSWMETLYHQLSQSQNLKPLALEVFRTYPQLISSSLLRDLEMRILDKQEKEWIEFLPHPRKGEVEQMQSCQSSKDSDYNLTLNKLSQKLAQQFEQHNIDPEGIDPDLIVESCTFKKKVKKYLEAGNFFSKRKHHNLIQELFKQFIQHYDRAVDKHLAFSIVRRFSREVRAKKEEDSIYEYRKLTPLSKFLDLWVEGSPYQDNNRSIWKSESIPIRRRIAEAIKELQASTHRKLWITVVHGTSSAALPIIKKLGNRLLPSGTLFKMNVAPFTGEAIGAVAGINLKGISFVRVDHAWEQRKADLPGTKTSSRFLIAESYATRTEQLGRPMTFDREVEFKRFYEMCETIQLGHVSKTQDKSTFWFDFKRAILRLKMAGNKAFMERSSEQLSQLEKMKKYRKLPDCIAIWKNPPAVEVDHEDSLIVKRFPLLFGASTSSSIRKILHFSTKDLYSIGETVVEAELVLGQDLDCVFTSPEGVTPLKSAFEGMNIAVLTLNAGHYLQMMQMNTASCYNFLSEKDTKGGMEQLFQIFQTKVLPYYAIPLPEKPTYLINGNKVAIHHPFYGFVHRHNYKGYIEAVKSGEQISREIHGPMHASRVTLFSLIFEQIYASLGQRIEVPRPILAITAGMHDAERQDEGEDFWDGQSADRLWHLLEDQLRLSDSEILEIAHKAIAQKDPVGGVFETNVQRIVHDSDCLDLLRVLLNSDPNVFRSSELVFTKLEGAREFPVKPFVAEALEFIKVTESLALKKHLEFYSQNYLRDLMLIFRELHVSKNSFPIMAQYLQPVLDEIGGGQPLDLKVKELIGL